jgi:hypothetical protein
VTSRTSSFRRAVVGAGLAALLFAIATPWLLRPWFLARDRLPHSELPLFGIMEDADLYLNVWILAWTAHATLNEPSTFFDGNIFYPARNTIAGSENMLAHLPVTVPALAATANALVLLKAMAFESFVLAGLAMFLYVRHHTGNVAAALAAGAAFTLAPWRVHIVPHPQYLATQYLPLAMLGVDLWLERRQRRGLLLLGAAIALQALACLYLGYFAIVLVPVYAAARLASYRERRVTGAAGVAGALAAGGLVVLPVALPYLRARAAGVISTFNLDDAGFWSWPLWWYVSPGLVADAGLATVAIVVVDLVCRAITAARTWTWRATGPEAALWIVVGVGVLLSAGPFFELPGGLRVPAPYLLLFHLVPGFSAVRAPRRFFIVVVTALAALAGLAVARWTARLPAWARGIAGVLLVVACALGAAPRPAAVMPARLGDDTPEVYRWLARQPQAGGILELPATVSENDIVGNLRNARYMVASTVHWHPILNGLTGHPPPSAAFLTGVTRHLPDADALAVLVDSVDVRWIVLHRDDLGPAERERWPEAGVPGLSRIARFGGDEVYAVLLKPTRPWREIVAADAPSPRTLGGVSTAPLAPECRAARILDLTPPPVIALAPITVPIGIRFENSSDCSWPALAVRPEGLVRLTYQWVDPAGRPGKRPQFFSRLLHDVGPHATVADTLIVVPEGTESGTWRLDVLLEQQGVDEPLARASVPVRLQAFAP